MKAKQLYFVLVAAVVVLLLGFVGVGYGVDKLMGGQAAKLSKLRADNLALDTVETSLAKNKRDLVKYNDLNAIAKAIVPQDKDTAQAVLEIVKLASQSGIGKLSSISLPTSTLGSATVVGGQKTDTNLTQLTPVPSVTGLYQLQITITQNGDDEVQYSQFMTFLSKLEQNRRTAQVSSITVTPNSTNPNYVSFNLVINEFIKR